MCSLFISVLRSSEIIFAAVQSHILQLLKSHTTATKAEPLFMTSFAGPGDTVWKHAAKAEHKTIILHPPSKLR